MIRNVITIKNSISIGICTSNDEKTIKKLLINLSRDFVPENNNDQKSTLDPHAVVINELIIVSSGCTDNTEKIISKFTCKYPEKILLVIENKRSGKANALNRIFEHSTGEYLVLIPADALTSLHNIYILINQINQNQNIGIAFGKPIINHKNHNCTTICKMNSVLWNMHTKAFVLKENIHASGELMVIRNNLFPNIPEIIINDDAYLSQIVFQSHKQIIFDPHAIVLITGPTILKDYLNQRKRIYLGHKQLKTLGFSETVPFNRLLANNKLFYLKLFLNEINSFKNLTYLNLALIIEFYLKLRVRLSLTNDFSNTNLWKRIRVDFPPSKVSKNAD